MKTCISVQDVCDLLNELLKSDYDCNGIVLNRTKCNDKIANHPTVQVHEDEEGSRFLGLIGIINGLFGINENGMGAICYEIDDDDKIIQFKLTE